MIPEYSCCDCFLLVQALVPPFPGVRCHGCQWVANLRDPSNRPALREFLMASGVILLPPPPIIILKGAA